MHHWKYSYAFVMLAVLVLVGSGCGQGNPRIGKEKNKSLDTKSSSSNYRYSIQIEARDKTKSENADLQSIPQGDDYESRGDFNTESYDHFVENRFLGVMQNPRSTFSIDVDTASYSNVRRMLNAGTKPPAGAVRIEEFVNYFSYDYPLPSGAHPFSVTTDLAMCPWNDKHQLVRIGLKGKEIANEDRGASNLVFLLDVSGSMNEPNKLPLVKSAMRLLVESLDDRDYISIVVYAGASGQVLPPTAASRKAKILSAIDNLEAGGSTNGGEGIELAYRIAERNFIDGGINRVILCTDGDFNVGVSSESELVDLITEKAASNIFLSVLGFGTGNYKDSMMEKLADKGNGNYAYIDSLLEARKTLVHEMGATLITIAKDVKIQINFNPQRVQAYRLLGYENRMLQNEDFQDDTKDAGEIGAGHSVTAIYEIIPTGVESTFISTTESDFVETIVKDGSDPNVLLMVDLRYKNPEDSTSQLFGTSLIHNVNTPVKVASRDFQFATSVAAFGMLLRSSKYAGDANYDWIIETAQASKGVDRDGFRSEFIDLAKRARMIDAN
jgi:Ca-activated chloride channel homolog